MTTAYNKRPSVRGRVHESEKSSSAAAFIEWNQPKSPAIRVLMTLFGAALIAVFSFFNWVGIRAQYLGGEDLSFNKFKLMSPEMMKEINDKFAFHEIFGVVESVGATPEEILWIPAREFTDFSMIFTGITITLVAAFVFLFLSILACKSKAQTPLAYIGFTLGMLAPLGFIVTIITINSVAAMAALELTVFPFLALLSGFIALVYCVRYPVAVDAKGRRNSFLSRSVTAFVPVKNDGVKEGLRKVVFTAALVSFIYFAATLGFDLFNEWKAGKLQDLLGSKIGMEVDLDDEDFAKLRNTKPLPDYLALWRENNDMVGYIRIGDTKVDYPVLQTARPSTTGLTGQFYLDHDFYGERSRGGAIFADHRNNFGIGDDGQVTSDNTILYGHNIATGNYFAALSNYHRTTADGTLSFYKTNPTIQFDTLYEKHEWKVFGTVLFNTQEDFGEIIEYWNKLNFYGEDDFNDYILTIMDRSVLFTDVDITYGDKLLTLSTCYWPYGESVDTRAVIFARRVREGESSDVDVEKAKYNRQAIRFAEEERRIGTLYPGSRVWDTSYLLSYSG